MTTLVSAHSLPAGMMFICAACGRSSKGVYFAMLNHKQSASMGLLWCPLCYEGAKGRRSTRGHVGDHLLAPRRESCMPLKKPAAPSSGNGWSSGTISTGTLLTAFPTLLEFLTLPTWPDGSRRERGTLLVFVDGSAWKACLKDKNGPRVCFVTSSDLDGLFLAIEDGLDRDSLDWRADRPQGGQRR